MAIQFKNLVDVFEQRTGAVATDAYTLTVSTEQTSGATPNPGTGGLKVQYYSVSSGTTHGFGLVAGSSSSDFLTSGPMYFYTNSDLDTKNATGLAMVLDTSQRLGIGTTNPSQKLEVVGAAKLHGNLIFDDSYNVVGGDVLELQTGGSTKIVINSTDGAILMDNGSGGLESDTFKSTFDDNNFTGRVNISEYIYHIGDTDTKIGFVANDNFAITTAGVERVRVTSGGSVGIAKNNPSQKLDVNGNVAANRYYGSSNTTYYVDPNNNSQAAYFAGDIRITDSGTATIKLDSTSIYPGASIVATKNGSESPPMGDISWNDNPGFQGSTWAQRLTNTPYTESSIKLPITGNNNFAIKTLGSDRMVINSSGNVGINTTSPSSKLQVNGAVQVANDTDTASASKVGALRYRTSGNNSYVDMCMQTGASTYAWVNIVQNSW